MKIKSWHKFQHFKDRKPPWIKLYRDLLDDPDWHELDGEAAKALIMLWLVASENEGELPDTKKLAFRLRLTTSKMSQVLQSLSHWLDGADIIAISPRYQVDTPETETETETQVEAETDNARARGVRPGGEFDLFWGAYPHKVGKKAALRAFSGARRSGVSLECLMSALARYKSDKPPDRQWCNPATWLNQGRWDDQPAEVQNGPNGKKSELLDACDNLIERIQGWGTPSALEIGSGEDAPSVRLLPKG